MTPSIPFNNLQDTRVPLFYGEVDGSMANLASEVQRTLIIGQITSAGTAVAGVPVICQGVSDAKEKGGSGSMLALMTEWYRKRDSFGEVWYLPLADAAAGVAASGTITYAGPTTSGGSVRLYIGGLVKNVVALAVTAGETAADIASQIATLINFDKDLPVTAAAVDGVVTITAKNKGLCGNDITIQHNLFGSIAGESLPEGLSATVVAMAGGATNPTLDDALANLGDKRFDFIINPYTDVISLNVMKTFLSDTEGRWAWNRKIYGHFFSAMQGTLGALTTFGSTRNDAHGTVIGVAGSPTPSFLIAANVAAAAASALRIDPARPLQTLETDVLPPSVEARFTDAESNTLLHYGVSTLAVADDGTISVQRMITTYQKNKFGQADDSFLSVETLFTLAYVLRFLENRITTKFARKKLAADGTRFAAGSPIVTPAIIRADQIAAYSDLEYRGMVQKSDSFKKNLIVVQNTSNPNRVDILWPGTLINQLNMVALLAQFRRI